MISHGSLRQKKLRRDLLIIHSPGHTPHDLPLSGGNPLHHDCIVPDRNYLPAHLLKNTVPKDSHPGANRFHGLNDPAVLHLLENVAVRSASQRRLHGLSIIKGSQHQNLYFRKILLYLSDPPAAVILRHPHVHEHHIRLLGSAQLPCFSSIGRKPCHQKLRIAGENRPKPFAQNLNIICYHYPNHTSVPSFLPAGIYISGIPLPRTTKISPVLLLPSPGPWFPWSHCSPQWSHSPVHCQKYTAKAGPAQISGSHPYGWRGRISGNWLWLPADIHTPP